MWPFRAVSVVLVLILLITSSSERSKVHVSASTTERDVPGGKSHVDRDLECTNTVENQRALQESVFELILAENHAALDPTLPASSLELKARGAHLCWHKHSTFYNHLLSVYNILRLWGQGRTIGRVGLFHSAYSNSYVNLALFDPEQDEERQIMKDLVGSTAEEIIYMFCTIDRQSVVVNTLLKQGFIPKEGIHVPHLRKRNETVFLNAETLRMLVVFSMADTSDQHFDWQDQLFGAEELANSMFLPGEDNFEKHDSTALWPGLSRPGFWMSYVSQLGAVAQTFDFESNKATAQDVDRIADQRWTDLPPVFDNCTKVLSRDDEATARDLYWQVVTGSVSESNQVIATLEESIRYNPWTFEPHVMLAQKYLHRNDFESAEKAAMTALELQLQWGTAWDKRLSFSAWVAWTRVLHQRSQDKLAWPVNSWDVINFGFVRGN